jgi:3-methyl-2-oxobutanoate hydroxymethyltransferase
MARTTPRDLSEMKRRGQRIAMLTAYDYLVAKILDRVGVPIILVGDSLGTTVLGYETTIPVTLADVIHHSRAVSRACQRALVVADMPFMTYHPSADDALRHAARLLQEGGVHAVKLEGGSVVAETIRRLVDAGIPVQGHLGLTPQSVYQLGGYRVQGKTSTAAQRLLDDARRLQDAGAFSIVLELIPALLARSITEALSIPTIGIGAGPHCDGQVQVISDLLGLDPDFHPRHVRRYAALADVIGDAVTRYVDDVRNGGFPGPAESFGLELAGVSEPAHSPVDCAER